MTAWPMIGAPLDYDINTAPTNPDACTCSRPGLVAPLHLTPCALRVDA